MKISSLFQTIRIRNLLLIAAGSLIQSFGLYHFYSCADITEGGILGLTLLLQHWTGLSPAVTSFVLTGVCYLIGWRLLGKDFVLYSLFACIAFSLFYAVIERFPPLFPGIGNHLFSAALAGAACIGIGAGLYVRAGGAPSGDDTVAMVLNDRFGIRLQTVYLVSDVIILLLSLTYLPLQRILFSLAAVICSGQLAGFTAGFRVKKTPDPTDPE